MIGIAIIHRLPMLWLLLALCLTAGVVRGQEAIPPREVKVLPIFFVPKGEPAPTEDQSKRLLRHLIWSQTRYRELLKNQTTFVIADEKPRIYRSTRGLAFYRDQPESSAPQVVSELLTDLKFTRYNCPYILLVVMMNPKEDFPIGGGRPLNGGFNTGGGIVVVSSFAMDRSPNFQSTLQHELGHSFGLPHVDAYGYDMKANDSLMSYNPRHHTNQFTPSRTPGKFIPEDLRGLALNSRALPKLRWAPEKDVPKGYAISERALTLGPMKVPDHPDGVKVTTSSGEEFSSKAANIVQGRIGPSKKVGKVTFDPKTMWQSAKSATGWASVDVEFPYEVELTRVAIHSQHSGEYHIAQAVRVAGQGPWGQFQPVAEADLKSADDSVTVPKTKGRVWRLELRAGESGVVVLRGIQFFSGDDEVFPPLVPYEP
jgi:hypothetical protein